MRYEHRVKREKRRLKTYNKLAIATYQHIELQKDK